MSKACDHRQHYECYNETVFDCGYAAVVINETLDTTQHFLHPHSEKRYFPVWVINIPASVNEMLFRRVTVAKYPTIMVVAAALVDGEGRVLLQRRPPGGAMAGLWEFPGGKVDEGETPEAALVRELREELGIDIEEKALAPAAFASAPLGERHLLLLLYICRAWRGVPEPLHATELLWLRPFEMAALPMPPADEPLIPILEALI